MTFQAFLQLQDEKGKLNFAEFCEVVGNTDVHTKMVVKV